MSHMSIGNLLFVFVWIIVEFGAGLKIALLSGVGTAIDVVLAMYLLTGILLCPAGSSIWKSMVGWLPAFVLPRACKWARGDE